MFSNRQCNVFQVQIRHHKLSSSFFKIYDETQLVLPCFIFLCLVVASWIKQTLRNTLYRQVRVQCQPGLQTPLQQRAAMI